MAHKKDIHVVPRGDGWARIREGSSKAASVHRTQKEAIQAARQQAIRERVDMITHGRDGRIRDSVTYGNDPSPPRQRIVMPAVKSGKIPVKSIRRATSKAKG
ncbi:MAG TPA: DUF2188 domain-containing protein [Woeseiaceae bacterium]|nr:DUF2188 domain-containing protein [Woeseiaceae bacterium]